MGNSASFKGFRDISFEGIVPENIGSTESKTVSGLPAWYLNKVPSSIFVRNFSEYLEEIPVLSPLFDYASVSIFDFGYSARYNGAILAPNGNVYGIPQSGFDFVYIDTTTDEVISLNVTSNVNYNGAVVGENGKIYMIPYSTSRDFVEIDPETNSIEFFFISLPNLYWGGVLGPDGKLYCAPRSGTAMMELDLETRTATFHGNTEVGSWATGVLASNGKIYYMPSNSNHVLEFDPKTKSIDFFGDLPGTGLFRSSTIAPNGKIYAAPANAEYFLEVDPITREIRTSNNDLSGNINFSYLGKFSDIKIDVFGRVSAVSYNIDGSILWIYLVDTESFELTPLTYNDMRSYGVTFGFNGNMYMFPFNDYEVRKFFDERVSLNFNKDIALSRAINKK